MAFRFAGQVGIWMLIDALEQPSGAHNSISHKPQSQLEDKQNGTDGKIA